jgi:hypothetical protein
MVLLVPGFVISLVTPVVWDRDFYRSGPGRSVYQTGFVLLWICIAAAFTRQFENSGFNRLLQFCSRHITVIYFTQWILIAWGTGIAGYRACGMWQSVAWIAITTGLTLGITTLITLPRTAEPSLTRAGEPAS